MSKMNTYIDDIPPGIGPHEGRELELMLAGEKPVAMFNDDIPEGLEHPENLFSPYVKKGQFISREVMIRFVKLDLLKLRYIFFASPNEGWRIERLITIHQEIHEKGTPTTCELEREIGQLLGYSESDIQVYLNRNFS